MNKNESFFGKYRGTVLNNIDPLKLGRIQAEVPDVPKMKPAIWAMPCVPIAGDQMGSYFVPHVGAHVWIEFEKGDPDHPVWVGGFWNAGGDVPALALAGIPASPSIVLQTAGQNAIVISDLPGPTGGLMLKSATGAMIIVNETGIVIENGKGASVKLTGPMVNINNGALTVP